MPGIINGPAGAGLFCGHSYRVVNFKEFSQFDLVQPEARPFLGLSFSPEHVLFSRECIPRVR